MLFEEVLQLDAQVICAYQARRNVSVRFEGDVTQRRSLECNLVRAKRSRLCIYAFVEKQVKDHEVNDQSESIANIRNDSTWGGFGDFKCETN